ncbi:efflux RND transporter periplasmic adaptor subunit [Marinicella gelatinilytica]|uniref:efflux RND transporter periplasmic adaptor subunit n=1 Tax=Marinicella gelatinilytica TaxID=2996017 RepID=UPI002260ABF0|nr:HlyD family efflux transporter periplasmic adaptor subunit [Marinicella gelatinilytica]MCX7543880.1 efflux RND transporter periplasmic adaptor subunit [Marinicella gelatinilytica]
MRSILFKSVNMLILLLFVLSVAASDDHDDHDDHAEEEAMVTIDEAIAHQSKIKTQTATAGTIVKQVKVYGQTVFDPSQISHIRARFAGTIQAVNVEIGDSVKVGDILAFVESNESLKKYPIKSALQGILINRHANPGEMAHDQVLFTIANYQNIWAELKIFPEQIDLVKPGQQVIINGNSKTLEAEIKHIIPAHEQQPYAIARVPINNQSNTWITGLMVTAQVTVDSVHADIVVPTQAIQMVDNNQVVFVKDGQSYLPHIVETGRADNLMTEILSGLSLGDEFVAENSYVIKADLEKSGASHHH